MTEKREVYVKCSTCKYEGTILISDNVSIYEATCPQRGGRTFFLYFIFPIQGG